jgi:hypothetical protein
MFECWSEMKERMGFFGAIDWFEWSFWVESVRFHWVYSLHLTPCSWWNVRRNWHLIFLELFLVFDILVYQILLSVLRLCTWRWHMSVTRYSLCYALGTDWRSQSIPYRPSFFDIAWLWYIREVDSCCVNFPMLIHTHRRFARGSRLGREGRLYWSQKLMKTRQLPYFCHVFLA